MQLALTALKDKKNLDVHVGHLNTHLTLRSCLVGYDISLADVLVWNSLRQNARFPILLQQQADSFAHVARWFAFVSSLPAFNAALDSTQQLRAALAQSLRPRILHTLEKTSKW